MSDLHLNSFMIKNFRIFDEITLSNLGRVNLIVGKNSVGKSTLLEALQIFATEDSDFALTNFLARRKEGGLDAHAQPARGLSAAEIRNNKMHGIFHHKLFKNRKLIFKSDYLKQTIEMSSGGIIESLRVENEMEPEDPNSTIIRVRTGIVYDYAINHYFLNPYQLPHIEELDNLWSKISLTREESYVVKALQTIDPDISQVNIVPRQTLNGERIAIARLSQLKEPVPLASLGDGATNIFHMILALIAAKDGILLADEIESGLHYSIQYKLWKLIFEYAAELNVQVFATTHSGDCISAFQMAAEDNQNEEGVLIRLENRGGKIVPTIADEELLKNAVEQDIEVR